MRKYLKPKIEIYSLNSDILMLEECEQYSYLINTSGKPLLNSISFVATVQGKTSHAEINLPAGKEYRINPDCNGDWHECTQGDNDGNKYKGKCEFNASCHEFLQVKNNNTWENVSITWYHLNWEDKWEIGKDNSWW